ncbi:hypothetical protein DMC30DRAFT_414766 [Rhodotorula diobovata]|uniref:NTF2 domain-containing protein n=1 Tax=Rhodotorula diobovata TaxID=5288 RepID=A0A5C5G1E7_9BASI|nr:hypothetical protein DMC30DRAFT_414766 [Rhodotorula diobovata]
MARLDSGNPLGAPVAAASIDSVVANSTRIADSFVQRYYHLQDLAPLERAQALPSLYAPTARITWNGNPIAPPDLAAFAQQMPQSAHDVQAFDCHPISGSASGTQPPSLVVTVSGQVTHGPTPTPASAAVSNKNFDGLARVFSQSLILVPTPAAGAGVVDPAAAAVGEAGYVVASDCFRFC